MSAPHHPADLIHAQRAALEKGRRAEEAGQPVIYIQGRPYADPASQPAKEPSA